MKKIYLFFITVLISFNCQAAICKKGLVPDIKMDDAWYKKEEKRLIDEEILLQKYSNYINKANQPLIAPNYYCNKINNYCDPIKNCQAQANVKDVKEVEYSITTDIGIIIKKSYCSTIGKCIGYNDFLHTKNITAAENRLIDIKKDNAIFYHYFYSTNNTAYEPPFNMTNFHTGSELYLNDIPHFSPDEKIMIEVRSVPKKEGDNIFPTGFNINIYQMNEYGEYKNIEPAEIDPENPNKIISTFLSRNPACGETPHFHSWKSNSEVRLSMLPTARANEGRKVILFFDKKTEKWGCKEDLFPEFKCESYLPNSTKFSSNIAEEQIENCKEVVSDK